MISIAAIYSIALLLWSIANWGFAWFFAARIVRPGMGNHRLHENQPFAPKASVLLSLRGCDPFLEQTLRGLLEQSYPDFEVIVVVDNRCDPAWDVAMQVKSERDAQDRIRIVELQNPLPTCSLKCSSLVQATSQISSTSQVVVLVDADVVPHANWLRDVVQPLSDPKVGVVTGNQWFDPRRRDTGSVLRSLWNSGALVATAINANPWAGTCAIRTADLLSSGLVDDWKTSVVDDGPIKAAMTRLGLRVHFAPNLIMVNRDQCTTAFVGRYVTRMLTWSRVYEPTFAGTVVHAAALALFTAGWLLFLIAALCWGDWPAAALLTSSMLIANGCMFLSWRTVRVAVGEAVATRGDSLHRMSWSEAAQVFALLPVCQLTHVYCTIKAIWVRQVNWRGITYRLHSQRRVEMVAYRPYVDNQQVPSEANLSV
ncbi:N-glycosyltransferase [Rosistilla carotiformis]|uniref:N-glycosyltransferase n=1 Tax=Rosistilla carotiformis TaxID=2528017 RepID=A0A518K135_9BACT|nr:glycosyltransferase [Rosistilla carotiformis]QDV71506.1 N-glycosyltransferase [Rosistilla carotiformis]